MGGSILLWVAYPLLFASGAGIAYLIVAVFWRSLVERYRQEVATTDETLRDIFAEAVSARMLVLVKYIGAPVVGLLVYFGSGRGVIGVFVGVVVFMLPKMWLQLAIDKRRGRIEEQVLDLINSLVATTKAGMNLSQSIGEVATRMPAPISQEFGMVLQRMQAGRTLEASLAACDQRLAIPNLSLILRSIIVNEQRGGPLPQLLDKIAISVREIQRVEERVKTETSGIKLSSRIMAAMPIFIGIVMYFMAPDQIMLLFNTTLGNILLIVVAVLDYLGFSMIKRLGDLEV
jgi:tight adherence protein B